MRFFAVVLLSSQAWAYTAETSATGVPLRWATARVTVAIDTPSDRLDGDEVERALTAACDAWSQLPEAHVRLEPGASPSVLVRFHEDDWPWDQKPLALTHREENPDTGEILFAVIDVNQRHHDFSVGDPRPHHYDLQAVLTHELGHVLGLGHSTDPSATMYASTAPDDPHQRDPDADDRAGIADLYAHAPMTMAPAAGCSVASGGSDGLALALLLIAFACSRRALRSR